MKHRIFLIASLLMMLCASLSYVTAEFRKGPSRKSYVPRTPKSVPDYASVVPVLEFASRDGRGLYLDLYRPKEYSGSLPVIMSIAGTYWNSWQRETCPAKQLCMYGYAVASIEIRIADKDRRFPAQIYDCKEAVRWLRANAKQYDLDPDRIGVIGEGAGGGHLAALLGTTSEMKKFDGFSAFPKVSSKVSAICIINPVTDLTLLTNKPEDSNPPQYVDTVSELLGVFPSEDLEKAKDASPITYISKSTCPFLIFTSPYAYGYTDIQSEVFHKKLLSTGIASECRKIGKVVLCYASIARFFDNHMGNDYWNIGLDNLPQGCRKIEK